MNAKPTADIPKLLSTLKAQLGFKTQNEFALYLGITQPHLSRLLKGTRGVGARLGFTLIDKHPYLFEPIKDKFLPSDMQIGIDRRN